MTLTKFLLSGKIILNSKAQVIEVIGSNKNIPYRQLIPDDWGLVYEKYVGQVFEEDGYFVTYRGLLMGFGDSGVDLIAENTERKLFIQCKYWHKPVGKSHIEWILYKASNYLYQEWKHQTRKIQFVLITPDKELNFLKKGKKIFDPGTGDVLKYPYLTYFLNNNLNQGKVFLEYREIIMTT